MNHPLIIVLCVVTLDAIGIGLIFPILPELLREMAGGGNVSALYGALLGLYALMQFAFAPVLGRLSDRYRRRPVLLVSLAGAATDYVVMATTPFLWLLFVSRAIVGSTAANISVATAYIADITPEKGRASRFGYYQACFGVRFILGPVIGGLLGDIWVRYPFFVAALLNSLNFALALFVLPESHKGERTPLDWNALNSLIPLRWALSFRVLLPLRAIFLMLNFIGQIYGTVWVLFGQDQFQWSATMIGLSLAAYGFFHAGAQAFATGPVTARLGERRALLLGMVCEAAALLILAFTTRGWIVFVILPLFVLGAVGVPALQSLMTNAVGPDKQGQLQGVFASLTSAAAIFGPLIFSAIYFLSTPGWLGLIWPVGALLYFLTAPILLAVPKTVDRAS